MESPVIVYNRWNLAEVQRKVHCMMKIAAHERQLNWKLPVSVAAGAGVVLASLIVWSPDADILYIFLIAPIASVVFLVLLVRAAVRKRASQCLSLALTLVAFLAVSWALLMNRGAVRDSLRWQFWSHNFKTEVLTKPTPINGELKHAEWEATGFPGVGNNTVYLVFDPSDSLWVAAKSHSPGKFSGIPCEVPVVRRLERQWYSVVFYTNEEWGQRNRLNCTGLGQ